MTIELYQHFKDVVTKAMSNEISETQALLNDSVLPQYDYFLASNLWYKIMQKGFAENWDNFTALVLDDKSNSPMPESVHKQFMCMILNIKNINLLTDLDIYEDLLDIECLNEFGTIAKHQLELKQANDLMKNISHIEIGCDFLDQKPNDCGIVQGTMTIYGFTAKEWEQFHGNDKQYDAFILEEVDASYDIEYKELNYYSKYKCNTIDEAFQANWNANRDKSLNNGFGDEE